jgi:hypothetical protein
VIMAAVAAAKMFADCAMTHPPESKWFGFPQVLLSGFGRHRARPLDPAAARGADLRAQGSAWEPRSNCETSRWERVETVNCELAYTSPKLGAVASP